VEIIYTNLLNKQSAFKMVMLILELSVLLGFASSEAVASQKGIFLPLASFENRKSYNELSKRSLDGFGCYRKSGHKHSGLDIKAKFSENVYSIANGRVVAVYGKFPNETVVIKHNASDGSNFFSSYTHITDILVKYNENVDENTVLGRVFNKNEFKKSGFRENHVHVEIRKTMNNYKTISVSCFTLNDLNRYFYNPSVYFKNNMN
jgi:murein DD-endopeptidase MepM/ murein hydrolase activator NlpD